MTPVILQTTSRFIHEYVIERYPILEREKINSKERERKAPSRTLYSIIELEEAHLCEVLKEIPINTIRRDYYFIIDSKTKKPIKAFYMGRIYSGEELLDLEILGFIKRQS